MVFAALVVAGLGGASLRGDDRVRLELDTTEAEAVLKILARRSSGDAVAASDWARLFESEPYQRLKKREAELERGFEDADFRSFVLSDELLERAVALERTLLAWKKADLDAAARRVLGYLPSQARIRAKVYPVIKPRTNSFVFELQSDPTVFLYLDPAQGEAQFENTVAHELHHIGLASLSRETDAALEPLPPRARRAAEWMGAFGEGLAMLAAAGGPDVHPHARSPAADRARWDRDIARFDRDLRRVERFFLDVVDGRLAGEDQIRERAMAFFGVQGPWYTVGWKMATVIEQRYGRPALIDCTVDPRRLLATYNRAVATRHGRERLRPWSSRLLRAVGARPSDAAMP